MVLNKLLETSTSYLPKTNPHCLFLEPVLAAIKWGNLLHVYMMTSSNGNIFRVTAPLLGEFSGLRWIPPHKVQWRGPLTFSLIYDWTNGWINNRVVCDLRHQRAHYDVDVMKGPARCRLPFIFESLGKYWSRGACKAGIQSIWTCLKGMVKRSTSDNFCWSSDCIKYLEVWLHKVNDNQSIFANAFPSIKSFDVEFNTELTKFY